MNRFDEKLVEHGLLLERDDLVTLQVNVGRKCNQACRHCHVDAAPWRTEMMDRSVAEKVVAWVERYRPAVVDITGGAPELNPNFGFLVERASGTGAHVIDRNNLTIIEEPGFEKLPGFLARHGVEVVASLPCYQPGNVNKQRGNGVFEKSINALRKLNAAGYGTQFPLHLVYNPLGPTLPPPQGELESDYKEALKNDFGIVFNKLFTITNQPIARFAADLQKNGQWHAYLELLSNNFNASTLSGIMCRSTLSVDYRGRLFDCDFNQMLDMHVNNHSTYLWETTPEWVRNQRIRTGNHCLACTAGAGSSCTGALA